MNIFTSITNNMTFLVILLLSLGVQQGTANAQAQSPTANSVIEKYIAAKGGETALRKIKNYTIKGTVLSGNQTEGSFEIYQTSGRHLSIDRFPDGTTRQQGTDGKLAWRIDIDGSPTLLHDQEARDYIRQYKTLHESLEWSQQHDSILYAGKKTIQNTDAHHLIFVAADKTQVNRYFAVESGLLIREEHVIGTKKNSQILISEFGNYEREKQNGTTVSRKRLNHFGSKYSIEFRVESLEANTITDDSIFAVPDSILKLRSEKTQ